MKIHYGTPEKLFPLSEAIKPIPVLLNGQPAYQDKSKVTWQEEYGQQRRARDEKIQQAQEKTEIHDLSKATTKLLESDETFRAKLAELTNEYMAQ